MLRAGDSAVWRGIYNSDRSFMLANTAATNQLCDRHLLPYDHQTWLHLR